MDAVANNKLNILCFMVLD